MMSGQYRHFDLPSSIYVIARTRIGILVLSNLIGIDLALCYKNLMKLTREEVQRVAMLARLQLTPEEEERLTEQLDNILQYVEKLNQLDTSGIEPFTQAVDMTISMREDVVTNEPNAELLLSNAPAQENNFFQVPKIIE
jgi:aspartyl-tRNA(Asn)/glutamyl-tRNA(Gln) amidotransferase subunit C